MSMPVSEPLLESLPVSVPVPVLVSMPASESALLLILRQLMVSVLV